MCYIYEIVFTIAGVNNYCDITRFNYCLKDTIKPTSATTAADLLVFQNKTSAVFDTPILLVTIYHMIEWLKWTVLLTTAMVDANLI